MSIPVAIDTQETAIPYGTMTPGPMFSVLVPIYNGTEYLQKCLAALAASQYDDFEVCVIDDGSTEPVKPVVDAYGFRYLRLDDGPGGPARARNYGAQHVRGRYLVFVDADVCVHSDCLAGFARAFADDPSAEAVMGSYDDAPADPGFLSQYKNIFHHYVHQHSDGPINSFWSGCGAIRRQLFLDCGGFDAQRYRRPAIEDIELGTWLSAAGHRLILDRRIKAKHLKRWTLWNLLKTDICDRGIPWMQLMLRAGTLANTLNLKPPQRLSVALVYLTLSAGLATFWWPTMWGLVGLGILLVTVLNLDFYRYFAERLGLWFTLRVIPFHWLYFVYCGVSVLSGTLLHYRDGKPGAPPLPSPTTSGSTLSAP